MMIKAIYNAKQLSDSGKDTVDKLGKVVYILDIDTASKYATIAYPVNDEESTFKVVGLGSLTIIDESITPVYFAPAPMLKSKQPAPKIKEVYEQGTKTVKSDFRVVGQKK